MADLVASKRSRSPVRVFLTILSLLSAFACRQQEALEAERAHTAAFPGAPIILISVDTLRSDRLPAYGYSRIETPAMDALRRDSILFSRAYSSAPLTLPAHASIFSGLLPFDHAVRDNAGYPFEHDRYEWLPEILRDSGYVTAGAVSSIVLGARSGFDRGFDFFEDEIESRGEVGTGGQQRDGRETLSACREWLRSSAGRPFFLFFHIYEPHAPWAPAEPFASLYEDPYDGEVAASDFIVGSLLEELADLDVYDDSLIVFLSDHGEGLSDHGEPGHGVLLYRESLQVPLMIKLPGGALAGETRNWPAQLVDVLPTILSAVDLPVPGGLHGVDLLSPLSGYKEDRALLAETVYPSLHLGWSELFSVIQDRYHYIEGPDPELYNLLSDPMEVENLAAREPRVTAQMAEKLKDYGRDWAAPEPLSDERRRELSALGYLGGYSEASGELPDPKTRIHVLEEFDLATEAFDRGDYEQAAARFRDLLDENPGMFDAWERLARSLAHLNRLEEALEACLQGVEVSGGRFLVLASARIYAALGREEDALRFLRSHAPTFPEPARLRSLEAGLLLSAKRFEEAATAAQAAVDIDPDYPDPWFHLGKARAGLGQLDEAEGDFRRLLAVAPEHTGAMNDLALLLMQSERVDEALQLLRRAVELRPGDEVTVQNLARAEAMAKSAPS